jgi:hypothetical protein
MRKGRKIMKNQKVVDAVNVPEVPATQSEGTAPEVTAAVPEQVTESVKSKGFVPNMEAILATSKSRGGKGSILLNPSVGYTLDGENALKLVGTGITPQMKVVLNILNENLSEEKPVISEPDLHDLFVKAEADGTLKTKQGGWYIFRYYRTQLVKDGVIVKTKIAA